MPALKTWNKKKIRKMAIISSVLFLIVAGVSIGASLIWYSRYEYSYALLGLIFNPYNFITLALIFGTYYFIRNCLNAREFGTFKTSYVNSIIVGLSEVIWLLLVLLWEVYNFSHDNFLLNSFLITGFFIWLLGTLSVILTLFLVKKYGDKYFQEKKYFEGGKIAQYRKLMKISTILFGIIYIWFFMFLMGEELQNMYHAGIICVPMGAVHLILFVVAITYLFKAYYVVPYPDFRKKFIRLLIVMVIFIILPSILFMSELVFYLTHNGMREFHTGMGSHELRPDETMPATTTIYFAMLALFFLMVFFALKFIKAWKDKDNVQKDKESLALQSS